VFKGRLAACLHCLYYIVDCGDKVFFDLYYVAIFNGASPILDLAELAGMHANQLGSVLYVTLV